MGKIQTIAEIENINHPWSLDKKTVSVQLHVDDRTGLTSDEAARRLNVTGPNKIDSAEKTSLVKIIISQFVSPFVVLLAVASALSFYFEEWLDGIAILAVVIINAIIGFVMEFQAERSMEALKKLTTVPAKVLRNGALVEIASDEVVPGDVLFVESGDMITADARISKAAQLQTDESALTGESLPVEKQETICSEDMPLAERTNMLFKGTFVSKGNGYAIVVRTGMSTELGAIASMVQGAEQAATPLEKKIRVFSKKLIWITSVLVIIIFLTGLINGQPLVEMLETSIALAVAAIPEGLPIVSTLALAFGMLRMARHNVIVKKLSSVETLGGTMVICTDKTGTLTQNKIEASFIQVGNATTRIELNRDSENIKFVDNADIRKSKAYCHLLQIASLCNTASYHKEGQNEIATGDPLEISLLKMVTYSSQNLQQFKRRFVKVDEIPFSSDTKVMATLHSSEQGLYVAAKGAVEELLNYCTSVIGEDESISLLTEEKKYAWIKAAEERAASGLRMLAFAYSNTSDREGDYLHNLTLAGLIGFFDPPRPEAAAAISECKSAGIKVVMITGDHHATAKNIAMQIGLAENDAEVMHGNDMKPFSQLSKEDKEKWLQASVFARVSPKHKLDLVTLFQEKKMVVGMTGDGVNDAPALKKADIGIAMGLRGTQVAQEVADMVLKDDAFSSIAMAIKQGRIIFENIRKFVMFLLSCNLSELFIVSTAAVLNLHFQLLPLQILYVNLVTDVLPALALGVTHAPPNIMKKKPYPSNTPIVDSKRWISIFSYSLIISVTTIAAVFTSHEWLHDGDQWNADICNNILFYTLIFSQTLHVFNMSFEKHLSFFKSEVFRNKYVWYAVVTCIVLVALSYMIPAFRKLLKVSMYEWRDWSIVLVYSLLSLLIIQLIKRKWIL